MTPTKHATALGVSVVLSECTQKPVLEQAVVAGWQELDQFKQRKVGPWTMHAYKVYVKGLTTECMEGDPGYQ